MTVAPLFSVIVPVYNKAEFVVASIESVLAQTCQDFELVVVCDPSTDGSEDKVATISDPRIRLFYRDKPGPGGYAARNLGIREALGSWITFLDADDLWSPNRLQTVVELIASFPEQRLFTTAYQIEAMGFTRLDRFSQHFSDSQSKVFSAVDYLKFSVLLEKPFHTNTVTFQKSLLTDQALFPEGRANRSGDLYAWVHLVCKAGSFAWSPAVGALLKKDVVGVSLTAVPSMRLNREMVEELSGGLGAFDRRWLIKYANRLTRVAHFEQVRIKGKAEASLIRGFIWQGDVTYCVFWTGISLFPKPVVALLKRLKSTLRI